MAIGAGAAGVVLGGGVVSVLHRPGISLFVVSFASLAILARWVLDTLETAASRAHAGQPLGDGGAKLEKMKEWWWVKLQREVQAQAGGIEEEGGSGNSLDTALTSEAGVLDGAGGGGELDEAFEKLMTLVLRDFGVARSRPATHYQSCATVPNHCAPAVSVNHK